MDDGPGPFPLSEFEGIIVIDADGVEVGELVDVLAVFSPHTPPVTGFFVEREGDQLRAAWDAVAELDIDGERLRLGVPLERLEPASLSGDEIALFDAVLDKQVLDMSRRAFVRVQDVLLEERDGRLVVTGVATGGGALARRFGLGFLSRRLAARAGDIVPWGDVNLISLRLSRLNFVEAFAELAELHPVDIADIVSQVGPRERAAVLAALNTELAADTLQEMEPELRAAALAEMSLERAVKVLGELDADAAADVLADVPDELAEQLLARLPDERELDLRELASHPEHSAGALMTTELTSVRKGTTAAAALEWIRGTQPDQHAMTYVYVLDDDERLAGVLSLRDLVLADPGDAVDDIMEDDVVTATADLDEEEVGRRMTRYNLLALPVVDPDRHLLGIVTLDDALDAILPEDWKRRLPRLFH
ncbi:MAG: magnesium transporter [Thermoleophilia bacterium]|nr:magnesium transporter [Thermoleophilia bacterium]